MAFKQVKVLRFLRNFLLIAKTTVPVLKLCLIEKPGFGNLLCLTGHKLLFAKKGFFESLPTVF